MPIEIGTGGPAHPQGLGANRKVAVVAGDIEQAAAGTLPRDLLDEVVIPGAPPAVGVADTAPLGAPRRLAKHQGGETRGVGRVDPA